MVNKIKNLRLATAAVFIWMRFKHGPNHTRMFGNSGDKRKLTAFWSSLDFSYAIKKRNDLLYKTSDVMNENPIKHTINKSPLQSGFLLLKEISF